MDSIYEYPLGTNGCYKFLSYFQDKQGYESEEVQQSRQCFDLSSESSDDNDWKISIVETKSKTKNKPKLPRKRFEPPTEENLNKIQILGVASVPGFRDEEDDIAEIIVNKPDLPVIDVESE